MCNEVLAPLKGNSRIFELGCYFPVCLGSDIYEGQKWLKLVQYWVRTYNNCKTALRCNPTGQKFVSKKTARFGHWQTLNVIKVPTETLLCPFTSTTGKVTVSTLIAWPFFSSSLWHRAPVADCRMVGFFWCLKKTRVVLEWTWGKDSIQTTVKTHLSYNYQKLYA